MSQRTQVAVIGGGPAGMLLSRLLNRSGIDTILLERRSRNYVEARIRAGVLESGTVDLLEDAGVAQRLKQFGLAHGGIALSVDGQCHRIDLHALTSRHVTVYGQTEIQKDLNAAQHQDGACIIYEAADVALHDLDTDRAQVTYTAHGSQHRIACDYVAGCDGYHGVCRASIPDDRLTTFERSYPFAWLGILAEAPPVSDELIYASHANGFALFSMRSKHLSRLYLQCPADEDLAQWPEQRIWDELKLRLGGETAQRLQTGRAIEKGITPMRSFVAEPMRFGRLFLAGDAAHIVPPTGAKGLNLAAADVRMLHGAINAFYQTGSTQRLDGYSQTCLSRIWKAQRFSWWMTTLMHANPNRDAYGRRLQRAEFDYVIGSRAAQRSLAENYVGLPFGPQCLEVEST